MEEKTIKNLEDTMNDCLDKAYACDADSEDYTKLIAKATAIANVLNENKKIDSEKEVELKRIEQQEQITTKDIFVVGAPIAAGGIGLMFKSWVLRNQLKDITEFEKTNSYVSSAGKWIVGTLRDIFNFNRRGL